MELYTKVVINKGRYRKNAGIVVNTNTFRLLILTADGNTTRIIQSEVSLLDPDDLLPFGIPVLKNVAKGRVARFVSDLD